MFKDATNVEHKMYDYTGNDWRHRNGNKRFKENFASYNKITLYRFTTKISQIWSTCSSKLEAWRWASPLVQEEKYRGENAVTGNTTTTTTTTTISAGPILVKEQYVKRNDTVCAQLHLNICTEKGVQLDKEPWNQHVPKIRRTSHEGKVTILWNQQVQTDRTIPNNKPDIVIRDNKKAACMLINVAISGDRNVIKRSREDSKISKTENTNTARGM
jgi:hypothetical protein